jgi:hypothetical protein
MRLEYAKIRQSGRIVGKKPLPPSLICPKFAKTFSMKKLVLLIIIFALAGLLAYRLFSGKEVKTEEKKDQPLAISKNSGLFNTSFTVLMSSYYSLKDALVNEDTIKADQAAYSLSQRADSLPINQLKADSNIVLTAQSLAASVGSEAKGLMGETGIEQRRRAFNMLTDELYNLIRVVRYDGEIIYHVRCPIAFKDSGEGYWLSNTNSIVNPYLGRKGPGSKGNTENCGEVNDSLDFTR